MQAAAESDLSQPIGKVNGVPFAIPSPIHLKLASVGVPAPLRIALPRMLKARKSKSV
jgi:hypothetical protein